ncbi:hypothetical protein QJQ45_025892, partial [Haematococcus lacustris]
NPASTETTIKGWAGRYAVLVCLPLIAMMGAVKRHGLGRMPVESRSWRYASCISRQLAGRARIPFSPRTVQLRVSVSLDPASATIRQSKLLQLLTRHKQNTHDGQTAPFGPPDDSRPLPPPSQQESGYKQGGGQETETADARKSSKEQPHKQRRPQRVDQQWSHLQADPSHLQLSGSRRSRSLTPRQRASQPPALPASEQAQATSQRALLLAASRAAAQRDSAARPPRDVRHYGQGSAAGRPGQRAWGREGSRGQGQEGPRERAAAAAASAAQEVVRMALGPGQEQLEEFEGLWASYAQELQLSKGTAAMITGQVIKGMLPCDAPGLRLRALELMALADKVPGLQPRALLAGSNATLRFSPRHLAAACVRLQLVLPGRDVTQLLVTLMPHLNIPVDMLVCELVQLEALVCPEFAGAPLPPRLFHMHMQQCVSSEYHQQQQQNHEQQQQQQQLSSAGEEEDWTLSEEQGWWLGDGDDEFGMLEGGGEGEGERERAGRAGRAGMAARRSASLTARQEESSWPDQASSPAASEAVQSGRLTAVQLLGRVRGLVSSLGLEAAYLGLARAPRPLLALEPWQVEERVQGLQEVLGVGRAEAALAVQARARLLAMEPQELGQQLGALGIALGWEESAVRGLVAQEPEVLLLPSTTVSRRWQKLQAAGKSRPAWAQQIKTSPEHYLAFLLSSPDPEDALARLAYLSANPLQQPVLPLGRAMRMTRGAFAQACPGFRLWLRRNRALRGQV